MNKPEIVSDPAVMMGKPVLAGTRITVEHILRELAAGTTIDQLLNYAADAVRYEVVYPTTPSASDEVSA
jgi:uncharacterized protein (DUF433 family)